MTSKTTIEVNGKRYDAITGEVIGEATAPQAKSGRSVDGFFRSRKSAATAASTAPKKESKATPSAIAVQQSEAAKPARASGTRNVNHARAHTPQLGVHVRGERVVVRKPEPAHHTTVAANHTKHHVAQHSKTLVRTGLQRPTPSFHKQAGTQGALQHVTPELIVIKPSIASIDEQRLARAQHIERSPQIAHHSTGLHQVRPIIAQVAVQPVPTPQTTPPVKPGGEEPTAPAPQPNNKPANKTDIFEHALASATNFVDTHAHVRHFKRQTKRHLASMAAGTLALVVIAGFAAYQNTPGLQFKVASVRAGVSTTMPNLQSAGFAYENTSAHSGKLTVSFSDNHGHYSMTQQATNLSSNQMIKNVGGTTASGHPNYVTVDADGTTIYRFDNTSATWVADGTWYSVSGNASLSDDQIKSLVQNA